MEMTEKSENEVLQLKDTKTIPDIIHTYTSNLKKAHVPIVIDNGEEH